MSTWPLLTSRAAPSTFQNVVDPPRHENNSITNAPDSTQTWEELAQAAAFKATRLAHDCHVSLRTLERHFRNHYHHNVRDWLRALRVDCAFRALQQGQSLKEAAYYSGFKQPSHFSREFKKYFGVSPSHLGFRRVKSSLHHPFSQPISLTPISKCHVTSC